MVKFEEFLKFQGIAYSQGKRDCYGIIVQIYKELFGIELINFARPENHWNYPELDLLGKVLAHDRWQMRAVNMRLLKQGDVIGFAIAENKINHLGLYVGNGEFIHHLVSRSSHIETLTDKWTSRALMVCRHPDMKYDQGKTTIEEILSNETKRRITEAIQS